MLHPVAVVDDKAIITYMSTPQVSPGVQARYAANGVIIFLRFLQERYPPSTYIGDAVGLPVFLTDPTTSTDLLIDIFIIYAWWLYTKQNSLHILAKASNVNTHFQALSFDFKSLSHRRLVECIESEPVRVARHRFDSFKDPRITSRQLAHTSTLPVSGLMLVTMMNTHMPYLQYYKDINVKTLDPLQIDLHKLDSAIAMVAGLFMFQFGARASNAVKTESDTILISHQQTIQIPPLLHTDRRSSAASATGDDNILTVESESLDRHAIQAQDVAFLVGDWDGKEYGSVLATKSHELPRGCYARAVVVSIRTSKTNQRGLRSVERYVQRNAGYCSTIFVDSMWYTARIGRYLNGQEMFFSRPSGYGTISPRKRLLSREVSAVVKATAVSLKVDPSRFSTKSLKYSGITSVAQAFEGSRTQSSLNPNPAAQAVAASFDHKTVSSNARYIKEDPVRVPYPLELLQRDGSGGFDHSALLLKLALSTVFENHPPIVTLSATCTRIITCACINCFRCIHTPSCPCKECTLGPISSLGTGKRRFGVPGQKMSTLTEATSPRNPQPRNRTQLVDPPHTRSQTARNPFAGKETVNEHPSPNSDESSIKSFADEVTSAIPLVTALSISSNSSQPLKRHAAGVAHPSSPPLNITRKDNKGKK